MPDDSYRVTARNLAANSENRIHSDEGARRYGYTRGLVPGVATYAYACGAAQRALGPAWAERGSAELRFRSPCHDGDDLDITAVPGEAGVVDLTVAAGSRLVSSGWAAGPGVERLGWDLPDIAELPAPRPDERAVADEVSLEEGRVLGGVRMRTDSDVVTGYLEEIAEPSPVYAERNWVHPGLVLAGANRVLMANVVIPAWLHVASEIRHVRAVHVGEDLLVRAQVAEQFERKGNRFVRLDVLWSVDGDPVAAARHTAMWHIARRS